jgi:hypothetical protein
VEVGDQLCGVGVEDADILISYLSVELKVEELFDLVFDLVVLVLVDVVAGDEEVAVYFLAEDEVVFVGFQQLEYLLDRFHIHQVLVLNLLLFYFMHPHNLRPDLIELLLCNLMVVYLCFQERVDDVLVNIQPQFTVFVHCQTLEAIYVDQADCIFGLCLNGLFGEL